MEKATVFIGNSARVSSIIALIVGLSILITSINDSIILDGNLFYFRFLLLYLGIFCLQVGFLQELILNEDELTAKGILRSNYTFNIKDISTVKFSFFLNEIFPIPHGEIVLSNGKRIKFLLIEEFDTWRLRLSNADSFRRFLQS